MMEEYLALKEKADIEPYALTEYSAQTAMEEKR